MCTGLYSKPAHERRSMAAESKPLSNTPDSPCVVAGPGFSQSSLCLSTLLHWTPECVWKSDNSSWNDKSWVGSCHLSLSISSWFHMDSRVLALFYQPPSTSSNLRFDPHNSRLSLRVLLLKCSLGSAYTNCLMASKILLDRLDSSLSKDGSWESVECRPTSNTSALKSYNLRVESSRVRLVFKIFVHSWIPIPFLVLWNQLREINVVR